MAGPPDAVIGQGALGVLRRLEQVLRLLRDQRPGRVPTPWNEATLALAREVVAGKREPSLANLAAVGKRAQADA